MRLLGQVSFFAHYFGTYLEGLIRRIVHLVSDSADLL